MRRHSTIQRLPFAALAALIVIAPGAAFAQDPLPSGPPASEAPTPLPPDIEARLSEVEQRTAIMERREEVAREASAAAPPSKVAGAAGKGMTITTGDNSYSLTIRARIQVRETLGWNDGQFDDATSETNIRTLRVYFLGHALDPNIKYTIQLAAGGNDFETYNASPIFDAFFDFTHLRDLQLRIGQYFVPFDRARTIREFALQFVDRQQIVRELTLDRDVGAMLYSTDLFGLDGLLAYNLGVFGGEGRNRFGGGPLGALLVARFTVRPFGPFDDDSEGDLLRLWRPRLAVGVAAAYNRRTTRQRSTTGNIYTLGGFNYTNLAADVVFKYAGFSFLGEALYRKANRDARMGRTAAGAALTEWSRSGWGYLAQAGMMLTKRLEITGRFNELKHFDNTDPTLIRQVQQLGSEAGAGLNYYLNGHQFKFQLDYQHQFHDKFSQGRHDVRLQLDATF